MLTATVVLVALLGFLGLTIIRPTVLPAAGLLLASAAWLPSNRSMEGPILFAVGRSDGVTAADLLSLIGALVAAATLLYRAWYASRRSDRAWNLLTVAGLCWTVLALGALVSVRSAQP